MVNRFEDDFRGIAQEYYPGSSRQRHVNRVPSSTLVEQDAWDRSPRRFKVGGVEQEFFTVGALAEALGRKSATIRKWEREGIIPRATFRQPSDDPRGVRRLYSRAQVEGIVRLANEEGLMNPNVQVTLSKTNFTERVTELFKELKS